MVLRWPAGATCACDRARGGEASAVGIVSRAPLLAALLVRVKAEDFDAVDYIAFLHSVHEAEPVADRRERRVIAIETEVIDQVEIDLRIARVSAAGRDSD